MIDYHYFSVYNEIINLGNCDICLFKSLYENQMTGMILDRSDQQYLNSWVNLYVRQSLQDDEICTTYNVFFANNLPLHFIKALRLATCLQDIQEGIKHYHGKATNKF